MGSGGHGSGTRAAGSYEFVRAPRLLGGVVASAVGYRSEDAGQQLHRGVPSSFLTLVISFDAPVVVGETPEHARGAVRVPLGHRAGRAAPAARVCGAAAARDGGATGVHPLAARALLGAPASELTRLAADGTDVLGGRAAALREQLCGQTGRQPRLATLTEYLRCRAEDAGRRGEVRPELAGAWRWMARHRGTGSMEGLARHAALSRRQLSTLFRREPGMGPKQVGRLMRFERARQALAVTVADGLRPDVAGVAAHCGYFDHSHLVGDFQQYAGLSPSRWIAEERRNVQAGGHLDGEQWDL